MNEHQVDVLHIAGDEGEQALVVEHVVDIECLGLSLEDWTWPEVVGRFGQQAPVAQQTPGDKPEADLEAIAARIIARHGDDWEDGYTASDADNVLQAINDLIQAAGLPGLVMLVWETADAWGPCGSSDLYYVTLDEHAVSASAAYGLVNGERDQRSFLALLDEIRRGTAEFVSLPGFPAIQVTGSQYQGIDARAC